MQESCQHATANPSNPPRARTPSGAALATEDWFATASAGLSLNRLDCSQGFKRRAPCWCCRAGMAAQCLAGAFASLSLRPTRSAQVC